MPKTLEPMKATLVDAAFDDDRWFFEVKWERRQGAWPFWTTARRGCKRGPGTPRMTDIRSSPGYPER